VYGRKPVLPIDLFTGYEMDEPMTVEEYRASVAAINADNYRMVRYRLSVANRNMEERINKGEPTVF